MKITNKLTALGIILVTGLILKLMFLFVLKIWDTDLFYYIEAARTMLDGGVLYKDFGCSHPPLGYFEFYWMAKFFGYNNMYLTIKIVAIAIQTIAAFFIYLIFEKKQGHGSGIFFSVLFLLMISVSLEFWAHNIPFTCLLPVFAGLYFLSRNDFQPSKLSFFIFGFMISCSALISTNMALYSLMVPVISLKNHGRDVKHFFFEGTAAFLGFLIPIGMCAVYFADHDALYSWYHWNIIWASIYGGFKPWYMNIIHLFYGMIITWQLFPFYLAGFYVSYKIIKERSFLTDRYANFTLWIFILALAAKGMMNKPTSRYYLYMIPGLVFTAAYFLSIVKKKTRYITIAAVTLLILYSLYQANLIGWYRRWYFPERANLRTWISENISHEQRVWVWDEGYELYYDLKLKRAKNPIFSPGQFLDRAVVWRGVHDRGVAEQWSTFMEDFTANPPDFIVDLTFDFERTEYGERIPREGLHAKWFGIFNEYVEQNYSVAKIIDGKYRILKLKKRIQ
jgi:hypothetical protein